MRRIEGSKKGVVEVELGVSGAIVLIVNTGMLVL